jgi:hypothetical protein
MQRYEGLHKTSSWTNHCGFAAGLMKRDEGLHKTSSWTKHSGFAAGCEARLCLAGGVDIQ